MKVPIEIARSVRSGLSLGFECDADGTVTSGLPPWSGAYPPPGYLPFNRLDVGNGDTYGYYWPIGREDDSPIVCTTMHDGGALFPLASGLHPCIKLHFVVEYADPLGEWREIASDLGMDVPPKAADDRDEAPASLDGPPWTTDAPPPGVPYWGAESADDLLPLDPRAPSILLAAASTARQQGRLDEAAIHLNRAFEVLPEFTAAWWELVQLRRQRRDPVPLVLDGILNCLTSPLAFGYLDRSKCLQWLQRLPEQGAGDYDADPIWRRRDRVTFAEGVYEHGDYAVYDEAIEEYHEQGLGIRAVRLRVLYGELMARETVSFRERQRFTWDGYRAALRRDCERAGLYARLAVM